VCALDYGRPSDRSVEGMLRERRGTCSTKHLYLSEALEQRFPETEPQLVHRVYRLDRERARGLFGEKAAVFVPTEGLVDVHRYLTAVIEDRRIIIDATFPGDPWDGRSSLPLAVGPGRDYPAGADPDAEKRALEAEHCDLAMREPFIAALAGLSSDEPIRIVTYDPAWPARFEEERRKLEETIGPWIVDGIHHVGSTAVPGLAAKPIRLTPTPRRDLSAGLSTAGRHANDADVLPSVRRLGLPTRRPQNYAINSKTRRSTRVCWRGVTVPSAARFGSSIALPSRKRSSTRGST
jgi:hypothetical protein